MKPFESCRGVGVKQLVLVALAAAALGGFADQSRAIAVVATPTPIKGPDKIFSDGKCNLPSDPTKEATDPMLNYGLDFDCAPVGEMHGKSFSPFRTWDKARDAVRTNTQAPQQVPTLPPPVGTPVVRNSIQPLLLLGLLSGLTLAGEDDLANSGSSLFQGDNTYGQHAKPGSPERAKTCPPNEGPVVVGGNTTCAPCDAYVVNLYKDLDGPNRQVLHDSSSIGWDDPAPRKLAYYYPLTGPLAEDITRYVATVDSHNDLQRRFLANFLSTNGWTPGYYNCNQAFNAWCASAYRYLDLGAFSLDTCPSAWHTMHLDWNATLGRYTYDGKSILAALHHDIYSALRARWAGLFEPWGFWFGDFFNLSTEFQDYVATRFSPYPAPNSLNNVMTFLVPATQAVNTWNTFEYKSATWNGRNVCVLVNTISPDSPISVILDEKAFAETAPVQVDFALDPNAPAKKTNWRGSAKNPVLVWLGEESSPTILNVALKNDRDAASQTLTGRHLFGNWTFGGKREGGRNVAWRDGFEALGTLDANKDGKVSGRELNKLALWTDANRNAKVDGGEIAPLSSKKISTLYYQAAVPLANADIRLDKGFEMKVEGSKTKIGALVDWVDLGYTH